MPFEILGTVREFSLGLLHVMIYYSKRLGVLNYQFIFYGMTETAGMITILDKEDFANGVEGVGQELPNVSMRLSNDNRICVQCESFGELEVEKTVFSSGWFITSDIGELKNGYWKISHRADKIVNSGVKKSYRT